jgi:hypothetical protein
MKVMKLRIGSVVALAAFMSVATAGKVCAQTILNWFSANQGPNKVLVSDSLTGSPTATLIYVPTAVKFSSLYAQITTADTDTADYYDIGIGKCPGNDCSQPNVTIDIVCDWGNSSTGINLASASIQSHPCSQTTPITIRPGVYVLLGAGNATAAKCSGQSGSTGIQPWATTVQGNAVDGSLRNVDIGRFKTSTMAGARIAGDSCSISLH